MATVDAPPNLPPWLVVAAKYLEAAGLAALGVFGTTVCFVTVGRDAAAIHHLVEQSLLVLRSLSVV